MEVELALRPATTRVMVFAWPDRSIAWEMAEWLRMFPPDNCYSVCRKDVVAARNWAMRELVLKAPARIQDFVFVDRDMRPGPRTLPFLAAEGDLVGCAYPTGRPDTWASPTVVHAGLLRFDRKVVEALKDKAPWWQVTYSPDGCECGCECGSFQKKVQAAGLAVARAGWCGHREKE